MQNISSSYVSEYEFVSDLNNEIISAIYPMQKYLNNENNERMILGGSLEIGGNRFDELGIPAGLYLEPKHFSQKYFEPAKTKQMNCTVIDDQLFDKLLGSVSSVKPYSGTRRIKSQITNRKTKKI